MCVLCACVLTCNLLDQATNSLNIRVAPNCPVCQGSTAAAAAAATAFAGAALQSVMLVELDGPRKRTVGIQVVGQTSSSSSGT